jgi:hypothetical protein
MGSRLIAAAAPLMATFMARFIASFIALCRPHIGRRGGEVGRAGMIVDRWSSRLVWRAILGISATLVAWACLGNGSVVYAQRGDESAAEEGIPSSLLGVWIQDDIGPVLTYRRAYDFRPDGSYEFVFTVRNTGAIEQTILAHEEGTFAVEGDVLMISSQFRPDGAFPWRVDKDPYVGDVRLVMLLPDGTWDVFFRP